MLFCSAGVIACSFLLHDTPLPLGRSNPILLSGQNYMKHPPHAPFSRHLPTLLHYHTCIASPANYTRESLHGSHTALSYWALSYRCRATLKHCCPANHMHHITSPYSHCTSVTR